MTDVRNLVERLRQIAESQRMDFDSPNVAATLDDAATTLEALAAIGSVVAEEPEWEYGVRHVDVDGWTRVDPHESRSDADADFSTCGMNCSVVRRRKDGPWVEVTDA